MAGKYGLIADLYDYAIKEITGSPDNWTAFLRSACRNYRLSFDEQVLVYVQRPDATAVLEIEGWNKKFGRWVKRDSKGIAVFDKSTPHMRLKYYFDISDTQESRYPHLVRPVPLWSIQPEYQEDVRETLANAFGVSEEVTGFDETILSASGNAAVDNVTDYLADILEHHKGSLLEEVEDYSIGVEVLHLLKNSVAYMLLTRCGLDAEAYLSEEDFRDIVNFNTPELINIMGSAVSDIGEMALVQVADTVKKLKREEQRKSRTFARGKRHSYNESSRAGNHQERSAEHEGNHLQQTGRLLSAGSESRRGYDGSIWEIRVAAPELSEGTPLRDLHQHADERPADRTSAGSTGSSSETDGTADHSDETGTERDGAAERERSDEVDRKDEQHPADSGGNGSERSDLQLRTYDRNAEDEGLPFFYDTEAEIELLLTTPHLKADKKEINHYFAAHEAADEQEVYIKGIFNNDYTELILEDGRRLGYKIFDNGILIWEGAYLSRTSVMFNPWSGVTNIFRGQYLLGNLKDTAKPVPSVAGQMSILEEQAGEKFSVFSFSQEIIDYAIRQGSGTANGKYRIYSFFLQNLPLKEKAAFLRKEYGDYGATSILAGTGIGVDHSAKGFKLYRGYEENRDELLLPWNKAAKRIDELIAAGRYMNERELADIPEYERNILAGEIYSFFNRQPEEVERPYVRGSHYEEAVKSIQAQLNGPGRVEKILEDMQAALEDTAESDRNYTFLQEVYHDVQLYRQGEYHLFSQIPAENETTVPEPEPSEKQIQLVVSDAANSEAVYDIQPGQTIYLGTEMYTLEVLGEQLVILRNQEYPLFTEEMERQLFEHRLRENPANDSLIITDTEVIRQPEQPEYSEVEPQPESIKSEP